MVSDTHLTRIRCQHKKVCSHSSSELLVLAGTFVYCFLKVAVLSVLVTPIFFLSFSLSQAAGASGAVTKCCSFWMLKAYRDSNSGSVAPPSKNIFFFILKRDPEFLTQDLELIIRPVLFLHR